METLGQPTSYYYFLPATLVDCLNKYKSGESSLLLISSIKNLFRGGAIIGHILNLNRIIVIYYFARWWSDDAGCNIMMGVNISCEPSVCAISP